MVLLHSLLTLNLNNVILTFIVGAGVQVLVASSFPSSTLPTFLDKVSCLGSETSISQCSALRGAFTCLSDHSKDAALRCLGMCVVLVVPCAFYIRYLLQLCVAFQLARGQFCLHIIIFYDLAQTPVNYLHYTCI